MTLQPICTRLCLPTLANLLGTVDVNGSSPAIDYLLETLAGETPNDRLCDVLLLYARDAETCPDKTQKEIERQVRDAERLRGQARISAEDVELSRVAHNSDRLLDAVFPQATLCRWLEAVDECERAQIIDDAEFGPRFPSGYASWIDDWQGICYSNNEAAARLNLKRRVLSLFSEVERHIDVEYTEPEARVSLPHEAPEGDFFMVSGCNQPIIVAGESFVLPGESPRFMFDGSHWHPTDCAPGQRSIVRQGGKTLLRRTLCPVDFLPPEPLVVSQFEMPG